MIDGRSGAQALEVGKVYRTVLVDREFGVSDEGNCRVLATHPVRTEWDIDSVFTTRGSFGLAYGDTWRRLFYPVPDYVQSVGRGI